MLVNKTFAKTGIRPSGTLEITENGTVDVTNYATANVNVSGGSSTNKFAQLVDKSITEVTADDLAGVTSIGNSAFLDCNSLTSITIPNSVTSIAPVAFQNCHSLKTIMIPIGVTSIGNYAFRGCSSLESITIPESVTSIGDFAFSSCNKLTSIKIPNSVTSIGKNAFSGCSGLTSVIYEGQAPDILSYTFTNCSSIQLYDFRNCTRIPSLANTFTLGHASGCQIVVPDILYEEWQQATNWSSLTDVVWLRASEYVEG